MFRPFFLGGGNSLTYQTTTIFRGDQPVGCDMIKKRRHVASSAQRALRCCFSWRADWLTQDSGPEDLQYVAPLTIGYVDLFLVSPTYRGDLQGFLGGKLTFSFCTAKIQGRMRLVNVNEHAPSDVSSCTSSPKNGVFCFKKFFVIMIHNVSFTATKPRK